jgi:hypothetical protein
MCEKLMWPSTNISMRNPCIISRTCSTINDVFIIMLTIAKKMSCIMEHLLFQIMIINILFRI